HVILPALHGDGYGAPPVEPARGERGEGLSHQRELVRRRTATPLGWLRRAARGRHPLQGRRKPPGPPGDRRVSPAPDDDGRGQRWGYPPVRRLALGVSLGSVLGSVVAPLSPVIAGHRG